MQRPIGPLFLQYARLDRKRSLEGLSAPELELLAQLEREVSGALLPSVPRGAERRRSIRVPAALACRWSTPAAPASDARITTLSRTGVFVRTPAPAPVDQDVLLSILLPDGGDLALPGTVANQFLGTEVERRGMGVRFDRLGVDALSEIHDLYEHAIVHRFGAADGPTSG